ncbi:MAG: alpha/beta hydrolase [Spirochaetes bacterium]|nr:alpha/beta hydrolase [Spirochaetota bacterium]
MKETIVFVHGMWLNAKCWDKYRKFFQKKGYQCITPTLRFHDLRPNEIPDPRLGTTGVLDYVEDLEKVIRKLKTKPILIGHSMGGLLVQILAARGLAKALVMMNPDPPHGIMILRLSVMKGLMSAMTKWGFWKKPFKQTFDEATYSMLQLLSFKEQKSFFDNFVYESGKAAVEIGFWFLNPKKPTKVNKENITCPTLIIGSKQDNIVPASVVRKIARKYKKVAVYKEYSHHSHWVIAEPGWQEICGDIHNWLKINLVAKR